MDLSNYSSGNGLIPDGTYTLQVEKYENKQTKDGSGEFISLTLNILGPTQNGRKIFVIFNSKNKNQMAVDIGMGQLKNLAIAAGVDVTNVNQSSLINAIFDAKIGNKTDATYGDKNVVKKYMPASNNSIPKEDVIPF